MNELPDMPTEVRAFIDWLENQDDGHLAAEWHSNHPHTPYYTSGRELDEAAMQWWIEVNRKPGDPGTHIEPGQMEAGDVVAIDGSEPVTVIGKFHSKGSSSPGRETPDTIRFMFSDGTSGEFDPWAASSTYLPIVLVNRPADAPATPDAIRKPSSV